MLVPNTRLASLIVLSSLFAAGCGSEGLGYVHGQVRFDGQPLENAAVEFTPADGTPAYGTTNAQGAYELKSSATQAGLAAGTYTVRITTEWVVTNPDGTRTTLPERLPQRYHEESELRRTVQPGRQAINFDLQSAAPR